MTPASLCLLPVRSGNLSIESGRATCAPATAAGVRRNYRLRTGTGITTPGHDRTTFEPTGVAALLSRMAFFTFFSIRDGRRPTPRPSAIDSRASPGPRGGFVDDGSSIQARVDGLSTIRLRQPPARSIRLRSLPLHTVRMFSPNRRNIVADVPRSHLAIGFCSPDNRHDPMLAGQSATFESTTRGLGPRHQ